MSSFGAVLLPLAANFVLLLAVDSTYIKIQMSCGMAMMPSVLLCMTHLTVCGIVQRIPGKKTLIPRTAAALVTISTALLVWFRICSVTNDQLAMEEGRTSVSAIAQMVTDDLMDEDVIVSGEKILIVDDVEVSRVEITGEADTGETIKYSSIDGDLYCYQEDSEGIQTNLVPDFNINYDNFFRFPVGESILKVEADAQITQPIVVTMQKLFRAV